MALCGIKSVVPISRSSMSAAVNGQGLDSCKISRASIGSGHDVVPTTGICNCLQTSCNFILFVIDLRCNSCYNYIYKQK